MSIPAPRVISKTSDLKTFIQKLAEEPLIAVDTESNSLHAYQEQVCLIQFSIPQEDVLVDPILLSNLDGLGDVFADESIEKIFHAAEYDVICLKRDFGFIFNNLFDTQIAARILGWHKVGLGNILEAQYGVRLNKKYQRANWKKRPLSHEMKRYAQLDTYYLISLRDRLEKDLEESGLTELAREDFHRISKVNGSDPIPKVDLCRRVNGSHELTPQQMTVLQQLCLYRDKVARDLDRPLFKVISDRTLVEIARHCPFDYSELQDVPGVKNWLLRKHNRGLLAAVKVGLSNDPVSPPRSRRPSASYINRMDAMHTWRKETARKMGVESDVVLPRTLMENVVQENPKNKIDLGRIMKSVPWRMDRYSEEILDVLKTTGHNK